MKTIRKNDFYEVKLMGSFSEIALSLLTDLYLPFIGSDAFTLYLAFLEDVSLESTETKPITPIHENLSISTGLSYGEIFDAMEKLEACSLVKTFFDESNACSRFVYCVFRPFSAKAFFDSELLRGILLKTVGKKRYSALQKKYFVESIPDGLTDVSSNFKKVFKPDFSDPSYFYKKGDQTNNWTPTLETNFDYKQFCELIKKFQYSEESLSPSEKEYICFIGDLFNISPETMLDIFQKSFNEQSSFGSRLQKGMVLEGAKDALRYPFVATENKAETDEAVGETIVEEKIRMMETCNSEDFLKYLHGNHEPASADKNLIKFITEKMGLPSPVANAVIDYVLQTNNNILNRALCEKIAGSVARELKKGLKPNSRDTVQYLLKTANGYQRKKAMASKNKNDGESKRQIKDEKETIDEEVNEETLQKAIDAFFED